VTITDDDAATWSLAGDTGVDEGASAGYTVSLSGTLQAGETASIELAVSFPAAGPSSDPAETADFVNEFLEDVDAAIADYNDAGYAGTFARDGNTLTYTQGASDGTVEAITIDLATEDDDLVEGPEDYTLTIAAAATPSSTGADVAVSSSDYTVTTTITDGDGATFAIDDVSLAEGDSFDTTDFTFTVTLNGRVDRDITLQAATADDTAEDETGDGDYTSKTDVLTFTGYTATPQTQQFTVSVTGDDRVELDEDFFVNLTEDNFHGLSVTIADAQGLGTIENDDTPRVTSVFVWVQR